MPFRRPSRGAGPGEQGPGTFDFLGFTHYWGVSRKGNHVVKRSTAKDRFSRTLHRITEWCRTHRHDDVRAQHRALVSKLRGHYAYFGITPNSAALARLLYEVRRIWRKWLSRRSQRSYLNWQQMQALLDRFPLPQPRIVHRYGT